jgi:large subunit ribosomal protein L9
VHKVGKAGSVVRVKDGYARNFLLPRRMAMLVTPSNLKIMEHENKLKTQQLEKLKAEAQATLERIQALSLTLPALTKETGEELYGSITSAEIHAALADEGIRIEKSCIGLDEPIKALGIYEVPVKLHPDVSAKLKVWIVKK